MKLPGGGAGQKGNPFLVCDHVSGCVDITDLAENIGSE